jgi:hypothetical protein
MLFEIGRLTVGNSASPFFTSAGRVATDYARPRLPAEPPRLRRGFPHGVKTDQAADGDFLTRLSPIELIPYAISSIHGSDHGIFASVTFGSRRRAASAFIAYRRSRSRQYASSSSFGIFFAILRACLMYASKLPVCVAVLPGSDDAFMPCDGNRSSPSEILRRLIRKSIHT